MLQINAITGSHIFEEEISLTTLPQGEVNDKEKQRDENNVIVHFPITFPIMQTAF